MYVKKPVYHDKYLPKPIENVIEQKEIIKVQRPKTVEISRNSFGGDDPYKTFDKTETKYVSRYIE